MSDGLLTIIIPIHKMDDEIMGYTKKAIDSINNQTDKNFRVFFHLAPDVANDFGVELVNLVDEEIPTGMKANHGQTDYQSQINEAILKERITTPYFSVLQLDDELWPNYTRRALEHIGAYPEVDLFIPIVYEVDSKEEFIGWSNESVWAIGHMDNFGMFDLKNTKKNHFYNYNVCGSVIKCDVFTEIGMFKSSMSMFQDYEFLLRYLNSGKKAMVIPKIGYKHLNGREGSIHHGQKEVTEDEKGFWYGLAQKEYHFDFDREILYTGAS